MLNMFAMVVKLDDLLPVLLTTLIFVTIGLVFFGIAFLILNLITPFSIRKEIEEDQINPLTDFPKSLLLPT